VYAITLNVINADFPELSPKPASVHELSNGFQTLCRADLFNGFHHGPDHRIVHPVAPKHAVDLEEINKQFFQVKKMAALCQDHRAQSSNHIPLQSMDRKKTRCLGAAMQLPG